MRWPNSVPIGIRLYRDQQGIDVPLALSRRTFTTTVLSSPKSTPVRRQARTCQSRCWRNPFMQHAARPLDGAQTLVWQQKIPNVIVRSVGTYHQPAFHADPDHLKPYVAGGEPVERARGSAAKNSDSALTTVYGHYFGPTHDQVLPASMVPASRTGLPTPAGMISCRQRRSHLCDYRRCLGAKAGTGYGGLNGAGSAFFRISHDRVIAPFMASEHSRTTVSSLVRLGRPLSERRQWRPQGGGAVRLR